MRILISLAAAATMMAGLAAAPPIALAAKTPPRVEGMNCVAAAAKVGQARTWQAVYWGWRESANELFRDQFLQSPCFTTQASCKAWLWWAQTDYPNEIVMKFCKAGAPYG